MTEIVLDYKASVPSNSYAGTTITNIPQLPNILQVADLGMFLEGDTDEENNRVFLFGDIGINVAQGSLFNNAVFIRIYRDGVEIFNTTAGLQSSPASPRHYNINFSTIDEGVSSGLHVYQLTVQAAITNTAPAVFTVAQVAGPITFSGLAVGEEE